MKLNELLLQSGNDIPFPAARVTIHQPRLREIAYIGEKDFQIGCRFLLFDKNKLNDEDKSGLENQSDFNIFMSVMNSRDNAVHKTDALMVLALLFPEHKIKIEQDKILLQLENFSSTITERNYDDFKSIINQMFCLEVSAEDGYNPADALAAKIAEKIKKAKMKKAEKRGEDLEDVNVYSKFVSVLSVGLQKDKNELMNYTVYQLRDEMSRFLAKYNYDFYLQAKLAGAKDLEEVENWMETSLKN